MMKFEIIHREEIAKKKKFDPIPENSAKLPVKVDNLYKLSKHSSTLLCECCKCWRFLLSVAVAVGGVLLVPHGSKDTVWIGKQLCGRIEFSHASITHYQHSITLHNRMQSICRRREEGKSEQKQDITTITVINIIRDCTCER